jgi:hypothetical protein
MMLPANLRFSTGRLALVFLEIFIGSNLIASTNITVDSDREAVT